MQVLPPPTSFNNFTSTNGSRRCEQHQKRGSRFSKTGNPFFLRSSVLSCLSSQPVAASLFRYFFISIFHHFFFSLFPISNNVGSRGPSLAIVSSSGYFSRSGSGTFTFDCFNMLINCSALTTPLP